MTELSVLRYLIPQMREHPADLPAEGGRGIDHWIESMMIGPRVHELPLQRPLQEGIAVVRDERCGITVDQEGDN